MVSQGRPDEKHGNRSMEWKTLTGPPIAPKMTASARFAAVSASSVSGDPVASIEACNMLRSCDV